MKFSFSFLTLTLAGFALTSFAEDQAPTAAPPVTPQVNAADPGAAARQVRDILWMADKGVSEKTMLSHIYHSPGVALSGEDVTALHKRGLSIAVITAMLEQQQRTEAGGNPGAPAGAVASIALSAEPEPIVYPTPAREAVPLTSPEAVYLSPYVYGYSPVIIAGSSFYGGGGSCYSGGYGCGSYGGVRSFGGGLYNYPAARSYGCGTSSYGYGSRYGCNSGPRGRF